MIFAITVFYISLLGVVITLCIQLYHQWVDRDLFFHSISRKTDYILRQKFRDWKLLFITGKSNVRSRANVFFHVTVKFWIAKMWDSASVKYGSFLDYMKGKQILKHRSAVSFYLKDIAKYKQHITARREEQGHNL